MGGEEKDERGEGCTALGQHNSKERGGKLAGVIISHHGGFPSWTENWRQNRERFEAPVDCEIFILYDTASSIHTTKHLPKLLGAVHRWLRRTSQAFGR